MLTPSGNYTLRDLLSLLSEEDGHVGICNVGSTLGSSALQKMDELTKWELEMRVRFDGSHIKTRRGRTLYDVYRD